MRIEPTIGRIVWYWPALDPDGDGKRSAQPFAAIVCYVHDDPKFVNIAIFDKTGHTYHRTKVELCQAEETRPTYAAFCEWMPYQIGQAKKHAGEPSAPSDVTSSPAQHPENTNAPSD